MIIIIVISISIIIISITLMLSKPVEILLNVIEPPLLTSTAAPQASECLTVFCILHLIMMMIMMMIVMTPTFLNYNPT